MAVCAAVAPECVYAADTAWVEESISTHETGSWSQIVLYNRSTGLATFTGWTDVAAQGISPSFDTEYGVSFVLDYRAGAYSVAVQDSKGDWRRLRSASGGQSFPLAAKANALKSIEIDGKAKFRSLKGVYTPERPKNTLFCFPDGRRREKSCFFASPAVGGGKNHAFLVPRQSAEGKIMLFWSPGSRRREKSRFFGSPAVGGGKNHAFLVPRQSAEEKITLFGNVNRKGDEKWLLT